ncbi:nuclear transport factor 2 family protein [Desertimonas flava]|uniref:nuclear transport factor 2 family protein n=1 Tax=Desertimonas flava TaxID=2064846 RepID=UPI000E3574B7|nr:nuclear transport factor 2 family protein [Desertimonas flava]
MGAHLDDADRRAITSLVHSYCTLIDDGDFDGFAGLFANGVWAVEGDPSGGDRGRDAVLQRLEQNVIRYDGGRPNTRHLTTNLELDGDSDAGTATGTCYVTVLQGVSPDFPLQPIFAGFYTDRFERRDGAWGFVERRIRPDLVGDLSRHRADSITE